MYDVVIIGAGIGGLVCGCYLAKAGMKVLIAEQHYKPGGYCTSFKRQGFTFDAAAHCFGGYREEGMTRRIFEDLGIDKDLQIIRYNTAAVIITPDYKVSFWADLNKTISDIQALFPKEAENIKSFFYFLVNPDSMSFAMIRSWTFKDLLDRYFKDEKLKAVISAPLLGMGGLPPSLMSAFIGAKLFSEFIIDGGYYPHGGMQVLPDALAERFRRFGGELRLACLVKKIKVKGDKVEGIITSNGDFVPSRYVVSNCDARQTFFKLLGKRKNNEEFRNKINNMTPSLSDFILYLGMDKDFNPSLDPGTNLCFFLHYDLEMAFRAAQKCDIRGFGGHMFNFSHDKSYILVIMPVSYKSKKYWENHKQNISDFLIDSIEKYTIPDLSRHIKFKAIATPHTLHRYTLNYKGASFGWAGTPSQLADPDFNKPSFIHGLYLTGHWTTLGVGISGVTYVGYDTARLILRKEKKMDMIKK